MGANGNLTGYSGGLDKKIQLLKMEKVDTNNFFQRSLLCQKRIDANGVI